MAESSIRYAAFWDSVGREEIGKDMGSSRLRRKRLTGIEEKMAEVIVNGSVRESAKENAGLIKSYPISG